MILAFFALNIVMQALERNAIRLFLRSMRSNGFNLKHILLIGYSRAAEGFVAVSYTHLDVYKRQMRFNHLETL